MFSSASSIWRFAMASISFSSIVAGQVTFEQKYCSTLNTADTPMNVSDWQSNGLCHDFCIQDYAFAVVQGNGCWCSNYVPGTTTTGCTQTCPGYPFELCGGIGLYGYVELPLKPSGTRGAIRQSSTTTTQQQQQTSTPEDTTTTSSPPPPKASSSWVPTPIISLETVTGQVRTVTVTPTAKPADQQNANLLPTSQSKSGLSMGGAVGLTVGLVAVVAIVAGIAYFCMKKRRKQKEVEYVDTSRESMSVAGGPIPSRSMSENSRYVLGTDGRQVVERWEPEEQGGQRKSRLIPVDQRLDPFSPVYTHNMNKSHESVNTIRDDHDYSRRVASKPVLRATNPD